jgi:Zn-finger nucleic acid-binding protein
MDATQVVAETRQPVLLDACFKCGAIWFDKTELTRASKVPPRREPTPHESQLVCPRCPGAPLYEEILYDERELAFSCYRCKGILVTGEGVDRALKLHRTGKVGREAEPEIKRGWFADVCNRCGGPNVNHWHPKYGSICRRCANELSLTGLEDLDSALVSGLGKLLGSLLG